MQKSLAFTYRTFSEKHYLCTMEAQLTLNQMVEVFRPRPADAHKGTMGHALIWAGSHGIGGCAILSTEACLRSGAGKVTIDTLECNRMIIQIAVPEAIVTSSHPTDKRHFQAIGIGPGIGTGKAQELEEYLQTSTAPLVIDADAIHLLAEQPGLLRKAEGRCILTPHPAEMQHLQSGGGISEMPQIEAARKLAAEHNIVIVLKGHPSRICLPNGNMLSCPRGNAGMATAGSGDVLTGIVTSLLAQGYNITAAATLGVWLHATAGDLAADELGQESMIARDITSHLPGAFKEITEYKKEHNT